MGYKRTKIGDRLEILKEYDVKGLDYVVKAYGLKESTIRKWATHRDQGLYLHRPHHVTSIAFTKKRGPYKKKREVQGPKINNLIAGPIKVDTAIHPMVAENQRLWKIINALVAQ